MTNESKTSFDSNWAGPESLRPKVYRTQSEKDTFHAIVVDDEYRCPKFGPDDVVIDIGAHIGSFMYKAYLQGSRSIYGFELMRNHYDAALRNLEDMTDGTIIYLAAVVRSDKYRSKQYFDNGAWNSFGVTGEEVASISLDDILSKHDSVRFLKIDCEGGEWPILFTSAQLGKVEEIAGEYHLGNTIVGTSAPEMQHLPYPVSLEGFEQFMIARGYRLEIVQKGPTIGNFYARKMTTAELATEWKPMGKATIPMESLSERMRLIAANIVDCCPRNLATTIEHWATEVEQGGL